MLGEDKKIKPEELTSRSEDATIGDVIKDILKTDNGKEKIVSEKQYHKQFHKIPSGSFVSDPVRGRHLITEFEGFGIQGAPLPRDSDERENEISKRIRAFVGNSVSDVEFKKLETKMSIDTEPRITHNTTLPQSEIQHHFSKMPENSKLKTIERLKKYTKLESISTKHLLKYRGDKTSLVRSFEWKNAVGRDDLEPGKVVLYHVRVYRPFQGAVYGHRSMCFRNPTFYGIVSQQEVVFHGGQTLAEVRDSIKCPNDYGPRNDVSENPNEEYIENLKEVFPSGVLFINNILYKDTRCGKTVDYTENIRTWARERGIADLESRSLENVTLDSLELRLGHPEVYIHQGACEHLFTFSQVHLLQPTDVCVSDYYPHSTYTSVYKANLCIICASYTAQWVVTNNERIPFDPAYLCTQCFSLYNYVDGKKIGDFKAYRCIDKNSASVNPTYVDPNVESEFITS